MSRASSERIRIETADVRGFLHPAPDRAAGGIVLTHGAGGDCRSPLLIALADAFAEAGVAALRCDLPFRQKRPSGPPSPAHAADDRAGLRAAVELLRERAPGAIRLGGHSYGGRQASMLAAEQPGLVARLLLLSYPLHPPNKPAQLRTAHFPNLRTPAVFVHGTSDPFGSPAELQAALTLIPVRTEFVAIEGAGHDLKRGKFDLSRVITAVSAADPTGKPSDLQA